jgi:spore maturation protein CgeB
VPSAHRNCRRWDDVADHQHDRRPRCRFSGDPGDAGFLAARDKTLASHTRESTLRILVVHPGPRWSVADVHAGWVEALEELGEKVSVYNLDARLTLYDRALVDVGKTPDGNLQLRKALTHEQAVALATNGILSACYQFWPDVVLVISYLFIPAEILDLLRDRGHKVVLVHTESPYQDDEQIALAAHADLSLVNDPTNLDRFREVTRAEYAPQAYRPSVHHPGPADPNLAADLAFVGTGFPSRIEFLERMDLDGLDVLLAGNWQLLAADSPLRKWVAHDDQECLDNEQTAAVYRSAKAGLNLYRREAERPELAAGYSIGPREVEMAATGLFFLRDPRPEGDELLSMLPTFEDPEEASELLRWYLARDDARQFAANEARKVMAGRTFEANAKRLLRLLDR